MTKVLEGIRVVELAQWGFVPSGAAALSDWGAEVIKIEHPVKGDPIRGLAVGGLAAGTKGFTPPWETFDRGKRAIGLDVSSQDGLEVLMKLIEQADVFITSYLPRARAAMGFDVEQVRARNPRIIYARGSGQGPAGPDAGKGGYDAISFWGRSGLAENAREPGATFPPRMPAPALGDVMCGAYLAGGIAAALLHRERTGHSPVVDVSLLNGGMWVGQLEITGSELLEQDKIDWPSPHDQPGNPLANHYRTSDGRYIVLNMMQADRYWSGLCAVGDRPELARDPRFADMATRHANREACVAALDEMFSQFTLPEWEERLAKQDGQWDVIRTPREVHSDPQAIANGYVQRVEYPDGRVISLVAAPAQFDEHPNELRPAGELGEQTDEVLGELGLSWDEIVQLKVGGVIS